MSEKVVTLLYNLLLILTQYEKWQICQAGIGYKYCCIWQDSFKNVAHNGLWEVHLLPLSLNS